jgi:hypothetical protein
MTKPLAPISPTGKQNRYAKEQDTAGQGIPFGSSPQIPR